MYYLPGTHLSFVLPPKEGLFQSKQGTFGFQVTTGTIHINQLCVNTIAIDYRKFISCPTLWKKAKSTANCLYIYILTNKNTQYRSKGSGKNWFLLLLGLSLNVVFAKRCEKKVAFLPKVNFRVFFKGGPLKGIIMSRLFSKISPRCPRSKGTGDGSQKSTDADVGINELSLRRWYHHVIYPVICCQKLWKILKLQLKKYTSHKKHRKPRMNPWFLQQNINLNIHTWASASVLLASNTLLCSAIAFTKNSPRVASCKVELISNLLKLGPNVVGR